MDKEKSLEMIARELSLLNRKMEILIASLASSKKVLENEQNTPQVPLIGSSGEINNQSTK